MRRDVILERFANTSFAILNKATEVGKHCNPTVSYLVSPEVMHCLKGRKLIDKIHNIAIFTLQ